MLDSTLNRKMVNPRELIQEGRCDITSTDPREGLKCGCHSSQSEFKGNLVGPCEITDIGGTIYASGNLTNSIIELNPSTGESTHHTVPTPRSVPMGLTKHSGGFNNNNVIWFVEFLAGKVGRFNPRTEQFTEFELSPSGLRSGPVAINVDQNGTVWFTAMFGNYLGKIQNGELEKINLPAIDGTIGPRGLDALENEIIVASNGANKLVAVNKETGEIRESAEFDVANGNPIDVTVVNNGLAYVTLGLGDGVAEVDIENMEILQIFNLGEGSRPSRLDEDSSGQIWVTEIIGNQINRIDPQNDSINANDAPRPLSSPEGIHIDANDNVWFVMWAADAISRFNPNTEEFTVFGIEGMPQIIANRNIASIVSDQLQQNRNLASQLIRQPLKTPELTILDRFSASDIEQGLDAIQESLRVYADTGDDDQAVTVLINNLPQRQKVQEEDRVMLGFSGWKNVLNIIITFGTIGTINRWLKLIITVIQGWIKHKLDP